MPTGWLDAIMGMILYVDFTSEQLAMRTQKFQELLQQLQAAGLDAGGK